MRLHDGLALDAAVVDDKVNDLAGHSQSDADSEPPAATRTAAERHHRDGGATMSEAGKGEAMGRSGSGGEDVPETRLKQRTPCTTSWQTKLPMPQVLYAQAQEAEVVQHVWADQAAESEVLPHLLRAQAHEAEVMQHAWAAA